MVTLEEEAGDRNLFPFINRDRYCANCKALLTRDDGNLCLKCEARSD